MSKFLKYWFLILVILISTILIHCGTGVTETGNPTSGTQESDDGDDVEASTALTETGSVIDAVCSSIGACFDSFDTAVCTDEIETDLSALEALGANTSLYASFTEVQTAIDAAEISVNSTILSECTTAIEDVSCGTMTVDGVFDEDSDDYSNVFLIIPEDECGNLF